eukprot:6000260-Ditylum_brightwellii.AAC.1
MTLFLLPTYQVRPSVATALQDTLEQYNNDIIKINRGTTNKLISVDPTSGWRILKVAMRTPYNSCPGLLMHSMTLKLVLLSSGQVKGRRSNLSLLQGPKLDIHLIMDEYSINMKNVMTEDDSIIVKIEQALGTMYTQNNPFFDNSDIFQSATHIVPA